METRQEESDFLVITNEETYAFLTTISPAGCDVGLVEYSVPEVQTRGLIRKRPSAMETVYQGEVSTSAFMELVASFLASGMLAPGLPGFKVDRKDKLRPPEIYVD
ncbi:MAG: hypothetical protein FWD29_05535 [Micrococcales bacterium]|nr:hypothetical protein [Micrococcales bacterium]